MTQQDYTRIRAEIEALQENIPNGTESAEIQQILQDLDQRYKDFTQQIEMWEERSSGLTSQIKSLSWLKLTASVVALQTQPVSKG